MKKLLFIFKTLSMGLGICSILLLIVSGSSQLLFEPSTPFKESIHNVYVALSEYSGLYTFTFIVLAFWATLKQVKASQQNNEMVLLQIKDAQYQILENRKRQSDDETLNECNYYFRELEESLRLIIANVEGGMSVEWRHLMSYNSDELKRSYPTFYENMQNLSREKKNEIVKHLYKIEAFSAKFIYGNMNLQMGDEIIGAVFCKQMTGLLGLISYFRPDDNGIFGKSIQKLREKWLSKTIEVTSEEP